MNFAIAILLISNLALGDSDLNTMKYASPTEFSDIPKDLQKYLSKKGYKIPQATYFESRLHNIVKGNFMGKGESYAVLANKGKTHLVILWREHKGKDFQETQINISDDTTYLQGMGSAQLEYSHQITIAPREEVAKANPNLNVTHDGLNDAFAEKASTLYYYDKGEWQAVAGGAD